MAVAFYGLLPRVMYPQEINAYKTVGNGNYNNPSTWNVFDGVTWQAASSKPTHVNDIYIDVGHRLTLTGDEEAKSVFINAQTSAGQKLNLNGYNLDIYGSLQAFDGAAPGTPSGTWNSQNWIGNSSSSSLTFKGSTRVIIPLNSWSGFSTQSRYSVIFEADPGNIFTIEEPIKAVRFTIRSGIVYQKLDTTVLPNFCPTLSFNTETSYYPAGVFGNFVIEDGGTLLTDCNEDIIFRSASVSANLFDLQSGGTLILEGTNPKIEAANFQMDGKVIFRGGATTKSLPAPTFADAGAITSFHDLEIEGNRNVQLPPTLTITGDMTQTGTGEFLSNTSHITFEGDVDQEISGFAFSPLDLTINKSDGEVRFEQDVSVQGSLSMQNGRLNFLDNSLTINSSSSGLLDYQGGSWENLASFTYANPPSTFNSDNGTFPFGDRYQGGVRKVQLLGTHSGGNLTVDYTEYRGADYNAGFVDTDNTPILYRLYSYFNFSGLNSSSNPLELRISADKLIVDEPEDLRLVCTGYAAPGSHKESSDETNLWAIRELTFDDLPGKNFTVGSFRTLSILPATWLSVQAERLGNAGLVKWSVAQHNAHDKFEIYRSSDPIGFRTKIAELSTNEDSEQVGYYSFLDYDYLLNTENYYIIKLIDETGNWSWSPVARLKNPTFKKIEQAYISPNPHRSGKITVWFPDQFNPTNSKVLVHTAQGNLLRSFSYEPFLLSSELESLQAGLYLCTFVGEDTTLKVRWIKK
ncbi:T9SS type A sorting domain-containing protein [Algoriphagus halophytocola]|uniref:T9SS type A sorting domain-containing protein n=1 Tax=Algoriphagus halophytocola TaxID=2991499 RepID=UPI0022DDDB8C|nr:T9SS type A sorting domain-containing protein [Algoriphagus sp. TR-M9]WBL43066.1 T9SS type A sorting domain-containing protein [Algoriphagus sp. TR-M9]